MGRHMIAVVLCVLALGYRTAGDIAIVIDNLDITPGSTSSLTINCTFSFDNINPIFGFSYLLAVTLSKSPDNLLQHYVDVAHVSAATKDTYQVMVDLNPTTISGHMLSNGETFLALQWDNPTDAEAGYYRCAADGLGSDGMPKLLYKYAQVTSGGNSVVG